MPDLLGGLTTNLLGIGYGTEAEADDAREDENTRSYKVSETIGGQILEQEDEGMRHSHQSALGCMQTAIYAQNCSF